MHKINIFGGGYITPTLELGHMSLLWISNYYDQNLYTPIMLVMPHLSSQVFGSLRRLQYLIMSNVDS